MIFLNLLADDTIKKLAYLKARKKMFLNILNII